jgi:hypothetical protein
MQLHIDLGSLQTLEVSIEPEDTESFIDDSPQKLSTSSVSNLPLRARKLTSESVHSVLMLVQTIANKCHAVEHENCLRQILTLELSSRSQPCADRRLNHHSPLKGPTGAKYLGEEISLFEARCNDR